MVSTEFFRTLKEAEAFQPCGVAYKTVCGLDKRGTVREFKEWQDDAIAWERNEAIDARACVVMYR